VVGDGIGEDHPLPERPVSGFPYAGIALVGEQDGRAQVVPVVISIPVVCLFP